MSGERSAVPPPAAYRVLARQYRPQTFDEVVGQDAVVRTLTNAIEADRVAHAFLFCGTRGVGKTTMARLLAKALNCDDGPTARACNHCPACREVTAGSAIDVLEIDGASHNKVDDVRELQESLSYQPVRDRHRVIIIDEVHMLSRSAFNALLKTLEEPPPHVVFIMATTELEKIPPTILSRCQHFTFRRIRRADIETHLNAIAAKEELTLTPRTVSMMAHEAAGSMRDALSALDKLVSFCGRVVDEDQAEAVLGALPAHRVDALIESLAEQDAAGALMALRSSADRGDDPHRFVATLLGRLRDLSVLVAVGGDTDLVDAGDDERSHLLALAGKFGEDGLVRLFQLAADCEPALRRARQPGVLLELMALRMVRAADLTPLADLAARLASRGDAEAGPAATGTTPAARHRSSLPTGGGSSNVPMDQLRQTVEAERPAVAAFLEHAEGQLVGNCLTLSFSKQHSFFKKSVEMPANRAALDKAGRRLFGNELEIRLTLVERHPTPSVTPAETPASEAERLRREIGEQPAVHALTEVFGAEMIDVKPIGPDTDPPAEAE